MISASRDGRQASAGMKRIEDADDDAKPPHAWRVAGGSSSGPAQEYRQGRCTQVGRTVRQPISSVIGFKQSHDGAALDEGLRAVDDFCRKVRRAAADVSMR